MTLEAFLSSLLGALAERQIRCCVLRNHATLPDHNQGNDVDLLLHRRDIAEALDIVRNLPGVRLTGFIKRAYVQSLFIEGVVWDGKRALEVDFVTDLSWKGLPYLDVDAVLEEAHVPAEKPNYLKVPAPPHEAIVTFFSSYLIGGFVKERYFLSIQQAFRQTPSTFVTLLSPKLGQSIAERLVNHVIQGDKPKLLAFLPAVKTALALCVVLRHPMRSAWRWLEHCLTELKIRRTRAYLDLICVLGPDGVGKSSVLERVIPQLQNATKVVEMRHLKPVIFMKSRVKARGVVTDPHRLPPRSGLLSSLKLVVWLAECWLDFILRARKNLTLQVYDRYFHDLLVDPRRYRYGGPGWIAKIISRLVPQPDLVLLLDAPAELVQSRKQELPLEETLRQRNDYQRLLATLPQGVVIDASLPLDQVCDNARTAILDSLESKTQKRLPRQR